MLNSSTIIIMTDFSTYNTETGETFSDQQIIEISRSISTAVHDEIMGQYKSLGIEISEPLESLLDYQLIQK